MKKINIVFAGEGGQGIQSIAKILSISVINNNQEASYIHSFGVEQRGTPSVAFITISDKPFRYPRFEVADFVVVLQQRAIKAVERYISPNTQVVFDSSTISQKDLPKTSIKNLGVPATKFANERFYPKSFNIIMLGLISKQLELPEKKVWEVIKEVLGAKFKTKKIEEDNQEAFIFGREVVCEKDTFTKPTYRAKHKAILYKGYNKTAEVYPKRCKGCGICIEKCPVGALSFSEDLGVYATPIPKIDLEKCIACGNCRNFCPDGAINVLKDRR